MKRPLDQIYDDEERSFTEANGALPLVKKHRIGSDHVSIKEFILDVVLACQRLLDYGNEEFGEEPFTIIFLDRDARPYYQAMRKLWPDQEAVLYPLSRKCFRGDSEEENCTMSIPKEIKGTQDLLRKNMEHIFSQYPKTKARVANSSAFLQHLLDRKGFKSKNFLIFDTGVEGTITTVTQYILESFGFERENIRAAMLNAYGGFSGKGLGFPSGTFQEYEKIPKSVEIYFDSDNEVRYRKKADGDNKILRLMNSFLRQITASDARDWAQMEEARIAEEESAKLEAELENDNFWDGYNEDLSGKEVY